MLKQQNTEYFVYFMFRPSSIFLQVLSSSNLWNSHLSKSKRDKAVPGGAKCYKNQSIFWCSRLYEVDQSASRTNLSPPIKNEESNHVISYLESNYLLGFTGPVMWLNVREGENGQ